MPFGCLAFTASSLWIYEEFKVQSLPSFWKGPYGFDYYAAMIIFLNGYTLIYLIYNSPIPAKRKKFLFDPNLKRTQNIENNGNAIIEYIN